MRFMIFRKADKTTEAGVLPGKELANAMMKYNTPVVTDPPFVEARERIAGYTMIHAGSREEAIEWIKRWPREQGDVEPGIRLVFEAADLGLA